MKADAQFLLAKYNLVYIRAISVAVVGEIGSKCCCNGFALSQLATSLFGKILCEVVVETDLLHLDQ
jgi:hypothetical protein